MTEVLLCAVIAKPLHADSGVKIRFCVMFQSTGSVPLVSLTTLCVCMCMSVCEVVAIVLLQHCTCIQVLYFTYILTSANEWWSADEACVKCFKMLTNLFLNIIISNSSACLELCTEIFIHCAQKLSLNYDSSWVANMTPYNSYLDSYPERLIKTLYWQSLWFIIGQVIIVLQ